MDKDKTQKIMHSKEKNQKITYYLRREEDLRNLIINLMKHFHLLITLNKA